MWLFILWYSLVSETLGVKSVYVLRFGDTMQHIGREVDFDALRTKAWILISVIDKLNDVGQVTYSPWARFIPETGFKKDAHWLSGWQKCHHLIYRAFEMGKGGYLMHEYCCFHLTSLFILSSSGTNVNPNLSCCGTHVPALPGASHYSCSILM